MREIKFRGDKIGSKQWVYGNLILGLNNTCHIAIINNDPIEKQSRSWYINTPCFGVIPESVGQFTGLQDKNGVDIYEGDIVIHEVKYGNNEVRDKIKGEVFYEKGEYLINDEVFTSDGGYKQLLSKTISSYNPKEYSCEIIGNIFENPELL